MLGFGDPLTIAITLAAVLVAATFHEFAHAFVADRLGDSTPRAMGRLSLNPLVHLDLLGTLFFVIFGFGWARPVPVNPDSLNIPAFWVHPQQPPPAAAGMHRFVWDLRTRAADVPTTGSGQPGGGGRGGGRGGFAAGGGSPAGGIGGGGPEGRGAAPLAPPGAYTVKLTVNDKSYTQPLTVKPDPRAER